MGDLMAMRPVFVPEPDGRLVREVSVEFVWSPGFSVTQKRRSIGSLHDAALRHLNIDRILEVSTKSPASLGVRLSAFNLHVWYRPLNRPIPLESAFQGSKVFAKTGQHVELYSFSSGRDAKRSVRAFADDSLIGFRFEQREWELEPATAFYDWLYLSALAELMTRETTLAAELITYQAFTDIEFNPSKSVNCQARSCALFTALMARGVGSSDIADPESLIRLMSDHDYGPKGHPHPPS